MSPWGVGLMVRVKLGRRTTCSRQSNRNGRERLERRPSEG